jgi:hypothetical protein
MTKNKKISSEKIKDATLLKAKLSSGNVNLSSRSIVTVNTDGQSSATVLQIVPIDDLAKRGLIVVSYFFSNESLQVIVANIGKEIIVIKDGNDFATYRELVEL